MLNTNAKNLIPLLLLACVAGQAAGLADEISSADASKSGSLTGADQPAAISEPTAADRDVTALIAELGSPEFPKRQAALSILKESSPEQIEQISLNLESHTDNEIIRRLIEVLELHYENAELNSKEVRYASESLEKAAVSDRWFIAETARDSLDRHWQRRTEMAILELQALNVSLSPKDPTVLWKPDPDANRRPFGINPTSSRHLKIYVDKQWPEGSRAFDLLKRLDSLKVDAFMTQPRLVSIYLIDGHPLTLEQTAILRGIFGDTGIAERGRVCLGVLNDPQFQRVAGVLVGDVQAASSADDAKIRTGDLIVSLNGEKLNDFEQLVKMLRNFDVGDKVTFRVQSLRFENETGYEDIEVTLKGWN